MHFKSQRVLIILPAIALCAAAAILAVSCSKGSINSESGSGDLCRAATAHCALGGPPIANIVDCVTKGTNDVIVGPGLKPGKYDCSKVDAAPSSATAQFGEIIVKSGGLLTVPAGATGLNPLKVADICLESGSQFIVGSADTPQIAKSKFTIIFTGNKSDAGSSDPVCQKGGLDGNQHFKKGIDVTKGATLELYGAKGVPSSGGVSWTTLAAPAGPTIAGAAVASVGADKLVLTADVTQGAEGWQKGDWIVVGTTSFNPYETEFVQINAVSKDAKTGGSVIKLSQPLQHYHFGSPAPSTGTSAACPDRLGNPGPASYCDGASQNYGVDERAEVGLISRDIVLTADTAPITPPPPAASTSEHWGGEIMIHPGFTSVAIQGVQLEKFGKDQLGSYPIHFHMVGSIENGQLALINADSVDHSYNKCVTIHDTANLTISNLVCARIVGHIFYEELDNPSTVADSNITFQDDLGLGAMSNSFDINQVTFTPPGTTSSTTITRQQLIKDYWWTGDYLTNDSSSSAYINYDGFNIPDTDNWNQPTHGSCASYQPNGILGGFGPPDGGISAACDSPEIYIEPATGFWIQNPATNLIGNAIGGCQGVGNGFWWVPPQNPITVNGASLSLQFQKLGTVKDNRAHACYNGFFGDNSIGNVASGQLFPQTTTTFNGIYPSIIATLDGVTATRNRFRGLWMRPTWMVVKNGRFATNRDNVTLLTSGGIDGNAPGVWDLLEDSVLIGLSQNNVERWGPCPLPSQLGPGTGEQFGCIDYTPASNPHSGDQFDNGYQTPKWNSAGYMLYDGPVRVFHDRFVNFNYNEGWTENMPCSGSGAGAFYRELDDADCAFLKNYENVSHSPSDPNLGPPAPYEGDAALGWFQSNQNSYPTGTASRQLSFVNTNLRHQVYTAQVSLNTDFNDGDKNTSIIDEDGTLDGLGVHSAPGTGTNPVHPISLNNLPFNSTSNSVDECLSRGAQNDLYEGRTSALMSPASMGTLQFSSLYPDPDGGPTSHTQQVTFTRDDLVPASPSSTATFHPVMVMKTGRNGLGSYEPKVSNGYGYTVAVSAGLWKWIDVVVADVVDPNISKVHPFYIRLGVNYATKNNLPPPDASYFTIKRGYKSYVGGNVWQQDPELLKSWTPLDCNNLDAQNPANVPSSSNSFKGTCPAASGTSPVTALSSATSINALTNTDGTPNLDKYYYNPTTGYLYLNVAQDESNPIAASPTGSCNSAYDGGNPDPACPDTSIGETYYACPAKGCIDYTIAVKSDAHYTYVPGPSSTTPPLAANLKPAPAGQNQLVLYNTSTVIERKMLLDKQGVPYHTATNGPVCKPTESPQP